MKTLSMLLLTFLSVPAFADTINCAGQRETVNVEMSRFGEKLTHNGFEFKDCRRQQLSANKVSFDCEDRRADRSILLFVTLANGRAVGGSVGYNIRGSSYGGPEDGSGINVKCDD